MSWNGQKYDFDEVLFRQWLTEIDVDKKIDLYEDDFSRPELSAMQNDTRQRSLMADRMGHGGWHIQIDSDEYFIDFAEFIKSLKRISANPTGQEKPLNVCASWISLIKQVEGGYLYVDFKRQFPEVAPFATNVPQYERARHSGHFNMMVPTYVVHETWARSEEVLWFKLNNWGHSSDELRQAKIRQSFYQLWKALDKYNYQYITDFHPAVPTVWPALNFHPAATVEEFISTFVPPPFPLSRFQLLLNNTRTLARLKSIYNKLMG
jgi:hypothetical protein